MNPYTFHQPATVAEACALLADDGARALAGGTDLVPQMREGRRNVARVVDLKRVGELTAVTDTPEGGVRIGGAASVTAIARHARAARQFPSVVAAAQLIGSLQIQSRASLGGNICNAAPSADAIPALMVLDARAEIASRHGLRMVPVEMLFQGPGRTTLAAGEILAAVTLAPPAPRSAACYLRFTPRREMDIAIAGAGASLRLDASGSIAAARIALSSVAPTPIRAPAAEACLAGQRPTAELLVEAGRRAAADARPISDTRGSADYRRELVKVLTARALARCLADLGHRIDVP